MSAGNPLSACERFVMRAFADGLIGPEIAARRGWSTNLPQIYAHRAKRKLRARTRGQAIAICVRRGLI